MNLPKRNAEIPEIPTDSEGGDGDSGNSNNRVKVPYAGNSTSHFQGVGGGKGKNRATRVGGRDYFTLTNGSQLYVSRGESTLPRTPTLMFFDHLLTSVLCVVRLTC